MLLTEQQAAGKWCPRALATASSDSECGVTSSNRDFAYMNSNGTCNCLGSRCMWWRWADAKPLTRYDFRDADDKNATEAPARPASVPADWVFIPCEDENAVWREPDEKYMNRHRQDLARRRGYCGLAGKGEWES